MACQHLTSADQKALGKYLRWVADELGLRDWWLFLSHEPAPDDCTAYIIPTEGRKHAVVQVCANFRNLEADVQRQAIVHELLHCHFQSAMDVIRCDLCGMLGQSHYDSMYSGFRRQMEYGVDGVADAIAKHFPLIQWPKK